MNLNKIESYFIHQNSFLDPDIFSPLLVGKKYDAVYNAAIMPYKRIELAAAVGSVALISRERQEAYFQANILNKNNFHLINPIVDGHMQFLAKDKVNEVYNQAYCGLCLSALEGAMYASVEYLLSGIPVVTTKSIGGRDYFFDRSNSLTVEDDPISVRNAVNYWVKNYDPMNSMEIRRGVISKQRDGISRIKILIAKLLSENKVFVDVERVFNHSFVNNFLRYYGVEEFIQQESQRLAPLKKILS